MSTDTTNLRVPQAGDDYGVRRVRDELHRTLRAYIEAQYHIRDEGLIRERRHLLEDQGSIAQRPFVEATPIYEPGPSYGSLAIPAPARELLTYLAQLRDPAVGIFDPPYVHQTRALEAFLGRGEDFILTTGTSSGKTESFLMPILGELALEARRSPRTARMPGIRALLLYPLNALVSDQLGRVRKLFGDSRVADLLSQGRGRRVHFGMYTSRTPYPGPRDSDRDARYMRPIFEDFYLERDNGNWREAEQHRRQLAPRGRWPCKDLVHFFGMPRQRWQNRLLTQPADTELMTRQEMQLQCPDLLITNYSMLEYMMLRPIERSLFRQTRDWLEQDPDAKLILVLDEAHTYRGAGGAEVALLIRRLRARLGLPRERFRCILTSASLGDPEAVLRFARDLTGLPDSSPHRISRVEPVLEQRRGAGQGTSAEAEALAHWADAHMGVFQRYEVGAQERQEATAAAAALAQALNWPTPDGPDRLPYYLFERLTGWRPAEMLIARIVGRATPFTDLASELFPEASPEHRERATEALLTLVTFARQRQREGQDDRILMPARIHLFFRGLPAQHACTNRRCPHRRDTTPRGSGEYLLGRLHTRPMLRCTCGRRTYEVLSHRVCGSAFLRGYLEGFNGDFVWHEPSGLVGLDPAAPLCEVQLLVEQPHPESLRQNEVVRAWLDPSTGRLATQEPTEPDNWLPVWLPMLRAVNQDPRRREFLRCPVCRRRWRTDRSEIMDLVTKGEAPFSNLVKAQVLTQPPRRPRSLEAPNEGRKVLLFSDGRQKAARLARDIPREVELDSFRQALALAVLALESAGPEPRPTADLYVALLSVASEHNLAYFEGQDQRNLLAHIRCFRTDYDNSLEEALTNRWQPIPIPGRYWEALLRQLCSRYYSLAATTLGYVAPARIPLRRFTDFLAPLLPRLSEPECRQQAESLATAWIAEVLQDDLAFGGPVSDNMRSTVAGFPLQKWGSDGRLSQEVRLVFERRAGLTRTQIEQVEQQLAQLFRGEERNGQFRIDANKIRLVVALNQPWLQCQDCTFLSPVALFGSCVNCSGDRVVNLDPSTSEYLRSRKGFWRDALSACVAGRERPSYICAEEHTAQLSYRDQGEVYATTERHELRFQDVVLEGEETEGPIDVLSCTTTMEVGVDIGSLVAIGLRNVPPQRENYQQRAGRAGRRGSAVSTVVTFSQEGPHDSYYFAHPAEVVSGPPRRPLVHTDNARIARRHVHSYLLQTFFHQTIDRGVAPPGGSSGRLDSALGEVRTFLQGTDPGFTLADFRFWVEQQVLPPGAPQTEAILGWLPTGVNLDLPSWIRQVATELLADLDRFALALAAAPPPPPSSPPVLLLDYLFDQGVLPTYAFPTNLCSFLIEERGDNYQVRVVERPQQALNQALSEYAPGRLLVINKQTYRSAGACASVPPTEIDRAAPLFLQQREYVFCPACSYVQMPTETSQPLPDPCPLCNQPGTLRREMMVTPEVFHPEGATSISPTDREQDFTYATSAQLPVPVGRENLGVPRQVGEHAELYHALDQWLVVVNRGDEETGNGFWVCDHCGAAQVSRDNNPPAHPPLRPYLTQMSPGSRPGACRGTFQRVFLGNQFRSDLMLLRLSLAEPFGNNPTDQVFRCALEGALRSFAEGLLLAASRQLDIDSAELSAGYRLLPREGGGSLRADIYLFDTLSGGAGYAEQAGQELDAVLARLNELLTSCICETSCQSCLRHYGNRFWHESLDRRLAFALLDYLRHGHFPSTDDLDAQAVRLAQLRDMLRLDGYQADTNVAVRDMRIPLLATQGDRAVAVGTYHGLLSDQSSAFQHPLNVLRGSERDVFLLSDFRVSRNLPAAYQEVRRYL